MTTSNRFFHIHTDDNVGTVYTSKNPNINKRIAIQPGSNEAIEQLIKEAVHDYRLAHDGTLPMFYFNLLNLQPGHYILDCLEFSYYITIAKDITELTVQELLDKGYNLKIHKHDLDLDESEPQEEKDLSLYNYKKEPGNHNETVWTSYTNEENSLEITLFKGAN